LGASLSPTIACMQAVSQLYLPDKFSRFPQSSGAIGTTIVTLGWFFISAASWLSMILTASLRAPGAPAVRGLATPAAHPASQGGFG
jgi:hypothetical protein